MMRSGSGIVVMLLSIGRVNVPRLVRRWRRQCLVGARGGRGTPPTHDRPSHVTGPVPPRKETGASRTPDWWRGPLAHAATVTTTVDTRHSVN